MRRVAERRFGKKLAPVIVKAWTDLSKAFSEFPNPVTSVTAWAPGAGGGGRRPVGLAHDGHGGVEPPGGAAPRFGAVTTAPAPSGLVRTRASPGRPPALVRIRSGWTTPVTAMPYLGSGSSIEWPPRTGPRPPRRPRRRL